MTVSALAADVIPVPAQVTEIQAAFAQMGASGSASFSSLLEAAVGGPTGAPAATSAPGPSTELAPGVAAATGSAGVAGTETPEAPGATSGEGGSQFGQEVVARARAELGVAYRWGGASPSTGFDCSGLVQYVFGQLGVSLPRTSEEQVAAGIAVPDLAAAQPGDLLFFEPGPRGPGHVGIYIGNGQMIDAPYTGADVRVDPVWTTPVAIRQVLPGPSGTATLTGSATTGMAA
ncbi:MAG: C40 family peptidase, partial [Actinomycetota bacterium]|nr:C40 family peptidase [Actinomycetota bacterium]